jgi:hypothetical protein
MAMPKIINSKVEGAVPVALSSPWQDNYLIKQLTATISCEAKPNNDAARPAHE